MDAPYYAQVIRLLKECFADSEDDLMRLNARLLRVICKQLGIETPIFMFSEMNLPIAPVQTINDLALEISRVVGASEYVNRPGGAELFDETTFSENGVKLTIQSFTNMVYDCSRFKFEPGLSLIDVMMWNSCEKIKHYLDTFRESESNELCRTS